MEQHSTDFVINKALRERIRELGTLLGNVIKEQEGQRIFNIVEELRQLSKEYRTSFSEETRIKITSVIKKLNRNSAHKIVKAFYIYFLLVNAADETYQLKARATRKLPDEASFDNMCSELDKLRISKSRLNRLINSLEIIPVFTAHPTEATRQTILRKLQRISQLLLLEETNNNRNVFSEELSQRLQTEIIFFGRRMK